MKIRIYYEDTDCGNVVYYANYLRYMERSRTELLRGFGIDLQQYHEQGISFAIARAQINYHAPARYNDLIDVETVITAQRGASIDMRTDIFREDGTHCTTGDITMVCLNEHGKAVRIPRPIRMALASS